MNFKRLVNIFKAFRIDQIKTSNLRLHEYSFLRTSAEREYKKNEINVYLFFNFFYDTTPAFMCHLNTF